MQVRRNGEIISFDAQVGKFSFLVMNNSSCEYISWIYA